MAKKKLTLVLMDAPFENARTVTGLRLLDAAIRRGHEVTVFAYEGAVALTFARQAPHANAVHGRDAVQEDHPLPKDWIAALIEPHAEWVTGAVIPVDGGRVLGPPEPG